MGFLSFFTSSASSKVDELPLGAKAPRVQALNQDGDEVSVDFKDKYVFIYFYPKADTPGCTKQACSLRDAYEQLQSKKVEIYGVSTDKPKALAAFKKKYNLPFTLLSDKDKSIAKSLDVPVKVGFASRQAFLFKDGKLVWLDRTASTSRQAEDVLKYLSSQN